MNDPSSMSSVVSRVEPGELESVLHMPCECGSDVDLTVIVENPDDALGKVHVRHKRRDMLGWATRVYGQPVGLGETALTRDQAPGQSIDDLLIEMVDDIQRETKCGDHKEPLKEGEGENYITYDLNKITLAADERMATLIASPNSFAKMKWNEA